MQFYKVRNFGELISSTFDFFKLYGKNYFKNYILLNGGVLILLMIVFWFAYGELFQLMFSSNLNGEEFFFEEYFAQNQWVLIGMTLLFFSITILLSLVSYSFPVLYMKRLAETGSKQITTNDIVEDLKGVWKKFVIFFFGMIITMVPIMLVAMFISGLLMMVLIGFFLILLIFPAFTNIINITLFDYYHTDKGFFSSLKYAFNAQFSKKNFWKYWGSLVVIYFLINVISSVFAMIPYLFLIGDMVSNSGGNNPFENSTFVIVMVIVYAISILSSFLLINIIYINCGFMYYDSRKDLHRDVQMSEIDNLGKSEI